MSNGDGVAPPAHCRWLLRLAGRLAPMAVRKEFMHRWNSRLENLCVLVDRGEVTFEARRYLVTHGAIEFTNPLRIEPFFDFEAETRVRVPGQSARCRAGRGTRRAVTSGALDPVAHLLERLKATPDGDGNLLDHSLILYGSGMSNSNVHDHSPLPILVAGGAAGRLKGGRHIVKPENTPMSNLLLSILNKAGIEEKSVGDSTEPLTEL